MVTIQCWALATLGVIVGVVALASFRESAVSAFVALTEDSGVAFGTLPVLVVLATVAVLVQLSMCILVRICIGTAKLGRELEAMCAGWADRA